MNPIIYYKKRIRYKYTLHAPYQYETGIKDVYFVNDYLNLDLNGRLTIAKKFAWDGPSGPVIDTRNFMRASLVHDALYQILRESPDMKDRDGFRKKADKILRSICRDEDMSGLRSTWVYYAVRLFGRGRARPELLHT